MDFASQALGIGALADPTRRALYDYVVSQGSPVGREQAAADLGLASHNANFHLDRARCGPPEQALQASRARIFSLAAAQAI